MRRRQVEKGLFKPLEEQPTDRAAGQTYVGQVEAATVIGQVLESLSDNDRELLQMRFWRNMTIAEIAGQTGLSYSATAVRLFRILHRLRDRLNR